MPSTDLGMIIRQARKAEKLSLPVLANAVGVSFSHLGAVERGESNPALDLLWRLCDHLDGLNPYTFVEGAAVLDEENENVLNLRNLDEELRSAVIVLLAEAL